ncbi:CGNR zinc finger domain-containing protein [Microterricola viridarii]|uniref:Conserved protein containing a Zn-ribbon-like motif, possibly RNA-binding n=1 Tax=Microterricola viridarii TaxID=412690 RepID=A0A1H1PSZ6_9MICO|nr:CGNR zinc finger domain-containing protein [Microterricola viridarii]SDS14392.1 Conserved protein containing a Zn-ribbon-like motif, possibly RNA-binding [Microterricola viridarii]
MAVASVVIPTGQWLTPDDGTRWWFDSGSAALDFAYTGPIVADPSDDSGAGAELLPTLDDLLQWLGERFGAVQGTPRPGDLDDAIGLRDSIARLAVAAAAGEELPASDIDIVNLFAATPDVPPALPGGSRQAGHASVRVPQALSTLAREAVRLFGPEAGGRIHACSADDCSIIYLDTSRAGSRRWCSMQRCGNRAKVRKHRAKAAAQAE